MKTFITVLITVAVVAAIFGIGFLCYKKQWARYVTAVVVFLGLSACTVYCGVCLNEYYAPAGGVFGKISNFFDPSNVEQTDDLTYDFSNIELASTDNPNEYATLIIKNKVLKLEENKTFQILVNGTPCQTIESSTDHISANYKYVFYDSEHQEILSDTLMFRFAFNDSNTEFTIKTTGGSEAVKYWNYYFAKNSFIVKIEPTNVMPNLEMGTAKGQVDYALANFYVGEELRLTQIYHINEKVDFPIPSSISSRLRGWSLNGKDLIQEYNITQNTNFYAVLGDEVMYTVSYYVDGVKTTSQNVANNSTPVYPTIPAKKGYLIIGWTDGESVVDETYRVTKDVSLNAVYEADYNLITITSTYWGYYTFTPSFTNENLIVLSDAGGQTVIKVKTGVDFDLNISVKGSSSSGVAGGGVYLNFVQTLEMDEDASNQYTFETFNDYSSGTIKFKNINSSMKLEIHCMVD